MAHQEHRAAAPPPRQPQTVLGRPAGDGEEIAVRSSGGDWLVAWHPPPVAPPGQAHGANAFCVSNDEGIVLISSDGEHWGWPGGRPEGSESWDQTLRREVLEETCSNVIAARLLGFIRSVCLSGHEEGLVLVRSIWRANVELLPWQPQHEIPFRLVIPACDLGAHLWMEPGFEPFYSRAAHEAALAWETGNNTTLVAGPGGIGQQGSQRPGAGGGC